MQNINPILYHFQKLSNKSLKHAKKQTVLKLSTIYTVWLIGILLDYVQKVEKGYYAKGINRINDVLLNISFSFRRFKEQ